MGSIARCRRCGDAASAVMIFSYAERRIWLDDLGDQSLVPPGYPLCDRHADRMTPPARWTLADLRAVERPLFVSLDVA
jgi:hypothetical protein